jgi:DNA polymerase-1
MQGTAADIIKRAMITVDGWLEREQSGASVIMQVHDELVLEVPQNSVDRVSAGVQKCMVAAAELKAPLKVEIGVGANWDEAH